MTDKKAQPERAMRVDTEIVRQLAEMLHDNDLSEIEVEDGDRRIVVKRQAAAAAAATPTPAPAAAPRPAPPSAAPVEAGSPAEHPGAVKSPMVGTVYLSGEPGGKPFVTSGSQVSEGDTLLIIEAMKVMNPIAAARSGTVKQVLVQDAQPVEFDQPLLIVE